MKAGESSYLGTPLLKKEMTATKMGIKDEGRRKLIPGYSIAEEGDDGYEDGHEG